MAERLSALRSLLQDPLLLCVSFSLTALQLLFAWSEFVETRSSEQLSAGVWKWFQYSGLVGSYLLCNDLTFRVTAHTSGMFPDSSTSPGHQKKKGNEKSPIFLFYASSKYHCMKIRNMQQVKKKKIHNSIINPEFGNSNILVCLLLDFLPI